MDGCMHLLFQMENKCKDDHSSLDRDDQSSDGGMNLLTIAWSVSGVLLNMVVQGMLLSYSSSLVPALLAPDSPIKTDLDTTAWISSSVGLAGIPGFLLSAYLMAKFGRRLAHIFILVPGFLGWVLIYFASNVPMLLIGRILGGITAGGTVSLGAIVIGEFTDPAHRGMFLNLKTAAVCLGSMVVHILGHFFTWRIIALIALTPYIIALGIICTWPESPSWLASQKRFDESEKAFIWLRGRSNTAIRELEELIRHQKNQQSESKKEMAFSSKTKEFFKKFVKKDFIKPLIIIFIGMLLLETSGRHLFPAYALQIISEITGSKSQSFYYTLAIDLIITFSATFSSVLVKLMKRRTLLFSTGFAAITVLSIVCLYQFLVSRGSISSEYSWVPISLFVIYFILVNLGCTPIPLALLGEIFPLAHRSTGSCIAGVLISLCVNMGLQLTPYMLVSMGVHGTFAIFALATGLFLILLYFILPETKDRTLQEIENYFNYGSYKCDDDIDNEEAKLKMLV